MRLVKGFNKTIIPFALFEYETGTRLFGCLPGSYPRSGNGVINNYPAKSRGISPDT